MKAKAVLLFPLKRQLIKLVFFFFLLLFSNVSVIIAQESSYTSVLKVLKQIEQKFEIKFSYHRRDIKKINVPHPSSEFSLNETIDFLSQNSPLIFTVIDERYIAVQFLEFKLISVCGILIDTASGAPLAGATIITTDNQLSSDSGGNFQINGVAENEIIRIHKDGFEVKSIVAKDLLKTENCPLVFIDDPTNLLATVVLNAYITKGIKKNAEGSISIAQENFEILPSLIEPDVLQIAQVLPGVESADETAAHINIRGGKSDEVLILWDDIKMYQSGHFFGLISAFSPDLTQEVTIYKDGTHPRFEGGISGLISMQSDDAVAEKISGGVNLSLISAGLHLKLPVSDNLSFNVSGRYSINSGIGNPVYNQFFDRVFQNTIVTNLESDTSQGIRSTDEAFNFYDISFKGLWDISKKDKVRYRLLYINNKLEFTERFLEDDDSNATNSTLEQNSFVNSLSYQRDWSHSFSTKINWYASNYILDESSQEVNTGDIQRQQNEVIESGIKIDASYQLDDLVLLSLGYQYSDTKVNDILEEATLEQSMESNLRTNSIFLDSKWTFFNNQTIMTFGLRFMNYSPLNDTYFQPRLNIFQKLTTEWSLQLSAEQKSQGLLQFIDNDNDQLLGIRNEKWLIANNEEIPIVKSQQISLGTLFTKNKWNLSFELFYKKVDDISTANQDFRNQLADIRTIGNYEVKGAEFSISKIIENFNIWLSYTYMENNYNFAELSPSTFRNNLDIRHSATLAASYTYRAFSFSLGNTYKSGLPYTTPVDGNEIVLEDGVPVINYNSPNNVTLKDYFRTDFSAAYQFEMKGSLSGKLSVAFLNIFNSENALDTYYILENDEEKNTTLNKIEQFSLGFTPNISFQLLF